MYAQKLLFKDIIITYFFSCLSFSFPFFPFLRLLLSLLLFLCLSFSFSSSLSFSLLTVFAVEDWHYLAVQFINRCVAVINCLLHWSQFPIHRDYGLKRRRNKPSLRERGKQRTNLKTLKLEVIFKNLDRRFLTNFQHYTAITEFCVIINTALNAACNMM